MTQVSGDKNVPKKKTAPPPQGAPGIQNVEEASHTKEVATRGAGQVAVPGSVREQEVLNSDILIPRILLMQGLSPLVSEKRKFQIGDIVKSVSEEKIGDDKHPVQFIPLQLGNFWVVKEAKTPGQKQKFVRLEPRNAKNEHFDWDFVENGKDMQRVKAINVFALLVSDIENFKKDIEKVIAEGGLPDLDKTLLPVMISFQSKSYKAGQAVATHFTKVKGMKQYSKDIEPYKYALPLECYQDKNDQGVFMVWKVGSAKAANSAQIEEAQKWYGILNSMQNIEVDMGEDGGEREGQTIEVAVSQF